MPKVNRKIIEVLLSAIPLFAQQPAGVIEGFVTDAETKNPLVGVNVVIRNSVVGTATDQSGRFVLKGLKRDSYTLVVSMVGYERLTVSSVPASGSAVPLLIELKPSVIATEQIVVTASRRDQELREVPATIATVDAVAIADRVTERLDEVLRAVPGIHMVEDQINIRGSSGYSRGVGSRVLLLLDGLPYLTGDTGEISWETIPIHQIERIEIVKGAGSALYGSGALGGIVNIITKDVSDLPQWRARLYAGAYDKPRRSEWVWTQNSRTFSGALVTYSGPLAGMGAVVSFVRSTDDSYRQNDYYNRWGFYSKLKYDITETSDITLVTNGLYRKRGNFFWWKSGREAAVPADVQQGGRIESLRGNVSALYKKFVGESVALNVKAMWYGNNWKDDSLGKENNHSISHVGVLDIQGTYQYSPVTVFTAGTTGNYDRVFSDLFGSHPGIGLALYGQAEHALWPTVRATLGARFDVQKVSALPSASQLSPKLGIVWMASDESSLRASLASGFRYPSISEFFIGASTSVSNIRLVPNPKLKPERSLSYEIGATTTLVEGITFDASLFRTDFTQLIEATVDPKTVVISFNNITDARIEGGEFGVKASFLDNLMTFESGYTYLWARDLTTNAPLRFRPRHLAVASVVTAASGASVRLQYRYASRIEAIDDNVVRLAPIVDGDLRVPIHVVDVLTSYETAVAGPPIRVHLNLQNALNYHYTELMGVLAPYRNLTLSLDILL